MPEGEGLEVVVTVVEGLGADVFVYGQVQLEDETHDLAVGVPGRKPPLKGDTLRVTPDLAHAHLLHQITGAWLPDPA